MDLRNDAMLVLGDLIGFPTVTENSNLDLIDYVANRLEGVASRVTILPDDAGHKANLFATIGPEVEGGVVLSAHTDVVPALEEEWHGSPFVATRQDQRIYGRGAADMKGFLACVLAMAPRFTDMDLRRPIHLAFTYDEEIGCVGGRQLVAAIDDFGARPAAVIVGEPTSMKVVTAHKGNYEYTTTVTGLESHGSIPDQGVNAIEYAAKLIIRLEQLHEEMEANPPENSPFTPPHTTISVGKVAGGMARNVVPGECTFEWEIRPVRAGDAERIKHEMAALSTELEAQARRDHPGAGIETVSFGEVDGLEPVADSAAVRLMDELLNEVETDVASYGTEAGIYAAAGIPAVVCGPGSIDVAHRPNEYIEVSQLEACLAMLERLGEHLTA